MILENIAKAIEKSKKTRYQISKETGVDESVLCRIVSGGSCSIKTADILCKYLKLKLVEEKMKPKKKVGYMEDNSEISELKKYHTNSWRSLATEPQSWLTTATNLKNAADAIFKSLWPQKRDYHDTKAAVADHYFGPVYMLLAGLAVETLIKGILVGKHPEYIQGQKLSKELTHHDLRDLYRTAGLVQSNSCNDLLLRLQNYVENFGRYPVTKTKQDMQKMTKTRFAGQTDPGRIDRLWECLRTKIQA